MRMVLRRLRVKGLIVRMRITNCKGAKPSQFASARWQRLPFPRLSLEKCKETLQEGVETRHQIQLDLLRRCVFLRFRQFMIKQPPTLFICTLYLAVFILLFQSLSCLIIVLGCCFTSSNCFFCSEEIGSEAAACASFITLTHWYGYCFALSIWLISNWQEDQGMCGVDQVFSFSVEAPCPLTQPSADLGRTPTRPLGTSTSGSEYPTL